MWYSLIGDGNCYKTTTIPHSIGMHAYSSKDSSSCEELQCEEEIVNFTPFRAQKGVSYHFLVHSSDFRGDFQFVLDFVSTYGSGRLSL